MPHISKRNLKLKELESLQIELVGSFERSSQNGKTSRVFNDFFTKLAGTKKLREQIEAGMTEKEIRKTWQEGLE